MSFVLRRKLSTLIPPKIASAANLGGNPNAKRMQHVVAFYKQLPQGPANFKKGNGPIARYQEKYFNGDNASGKPLLHFSLALLALGYGMEYYFHLRHHKSGAH